MNKKRIYIAGRITGLSSNEAQLNFERGCSKIYEMNAIPLNPYNIYLGNKGTWKDYMSICIPMLFACDEIYMLNNWKESKGACIEHALAEGAGMNIIYEN